jgi:general secretion pathway protein M
LKINLSKSQAAALGLLLAAFALLYIAAVAPLAEIGAGYAERIDDLEFKLTKMRKVAAEKDFWIQRLEEIKQQGKTQGRFISRDTAALASADLQTRIKEVVNQAGGELISTQVIPERKEEQFVRIAVKVRMTGSTEVLRDVLHDFEAGSPILFVENLNIRPIRIVQPRLPNSPAAKQPPKVQDRLSVDFDVVGYMQGG